MEFYRANGDCVCPICGYRYIEHPLDNDTVDFEGNPFLHILCNGDRVKL